ncbi:MAG: hypothetical protein IKQ33_05240, partial [Clostridia bacterium]|nr:hypothetical protein [Clostridia bacterium]
IEEYERQSRARLDSLAKLEAEEVVFKLQMLARSYGDSIGFMLRVKSIKSINKNLSNYNREIFVFIS